MSLWLTPFYVVKIQPDSAVARIEHATVRSAMKTSELTSPLLDAWVAKAECRQNVTIWNGRCFCDQEHSLGTGFMPTQFWGVGGPIIERERLHCIPADGPAGPGWASFADDWGTERIEYGPTPLIAAMRAYVASKYGEEVPE